MIAKRKLFDVLGLWEIALKKEFHNIITPIKLNSSEKKWCIVLDITLVNFFKFSFSISIHHKWNGTNYLQKKNLEVASWVAERLKVILRKPLKCFELKASAHPATQKENFDHFSKNCEKISCRILCFTEFCEFVQDCLRKHQM